jgi:hypothetical protein
MIISHKHKFIFIKNEKTAGSSVEIALSKICGPEDIITALTPDDAQYRRELGYRGKQNLSIPLSKYSRLDIAWAIFRLRRRTFYSHIPATEIKRAIEPEVWDSYFKFCFERNPFDKFISWYYWSGGEKTYSTMRSFIDSGMASRVRGFELYTIDSLPVVDKIYRFEALQEGLDDISDRLQLGERLVLPDRKTKGHIRKNKAHYREILGEYEIEWISKIFAREIKYFDYQY